MKRLICVLLLMLVSCGFVSKANGLYVPDLATEIRSHSVYVAEYNEGTQVGSGSGTIIKYGNTVALLTAWHVIEDIDKGNTYQVCSVLDIKDCVGIDGPMLTPIEEYGINDWVILFISSVPKNSTPAMLRNKPLKVGEETYLCSSPLGIPGLISEGIVAGITKGGTFFTTSEGTFGSSGGGIYDKNRKLIGMITGMPWQQGQIGNTPLNSFMLGIPASVFVSVQNKMKDRKLFR